MTKRRNALADLGIVLPQKSKDTLLSVRLTTDDASKLEALAKKLGVRGRSTMARLILEKFIAEHAPDRKGKR
jgi:metal-responsive CopG/Arc/MetJ family transcriptional regulator